MYKKLLLRLTTAIKTQKKAPTPKSEGPKIRNTAIIAHPADWMQKEGKTL